jgi:hypothetical protein
MIIALMALALAMIVGGLLTVFLGWDIVLVERGWTMVIAGTISAASGALLLGITAAISKLVSIQVELARLQGGFNVGETLDGETAPRDLSPAALAGGLLSGLSFGRAGAKKQDEEQDTLPLFAEQEKAEQGPEAEEAAKPDESVIPFPPRPPVEATPSRDEDVADVKVPDFLLAERLRETYVESRIADADESLYASEPETSEEDTAAGKGREEDVTPAAWPEPPAEPEPEPAMEPAPEPEAASEDEEPRSATIIGTYNSGDNKYVMFSDGSIEAQTPGGVFRFKSLDELKEFIASGGEGGSAASI